MVSLDDSSDFAFSGFFTIGDGGGDDGDGWDDNYADGKVTKPNANSLWWAGYSFAIKWSGLGGNSVSIDLYSGWTYHGSIAASTTNDGSYSWYIPWKVPPGFFYYIVIKSTNGSQAISDYFTIW